MRRWLCAAGVFLPGACSEPAPEPANLLLITADALRADRLQPSLFGSLSALMDEALVFERCLSSAPSSAGAVGGLLTGRYARDVGSPSPMRPLDPDAETLAQLLAERGWQTAAFVSTRALGSELGWARGFGRFDEPGQDRATRDDYDVTRAARNWLLHERDSERPFFLWVHLSGGHGPYAVERDQAYDALRPFRKALAEARADHGEGRSLPLLEGNRGPGGIPRYQQGGPRGGGRSETRHVLNHDLRVMRTCFLAGELRHVLKYAGLYENTALVFHGTHGEALGEHGLFFQHGENLFREDLSVPLILWVPGTRPGRTNEIVSTLDLMPTLLALFDVPPPVALRGEDLLSVEGPTRGWAFSESYPPSAAARTCALTGPRWKVLQSVAGDVRVFDLERDPMERTGLATPYPAEARAWLDRFEALRVEPREAGPERTLSDAELRLWRGLGYDL